MKYYRLLLFPALLLALISCKLTPDYNKLLNLIEQDIESGNNKSAVHLADSLKSKYADNIPFFRKADSLSQIAERINLDFSVTDDQIIAQIEKRSGAFTHEDMEAWENKGWLEYKLIDGKKMYFNRAASNLMLIRKFYEQKEQRLLDIAGDPAMIFRLGHTENVLKTAHNQNNPVVPVNMKIIYTITVHPDVVPDGNVIRCWMPWPEKGNPRQQKVELINTSNPEYIIAPDSAIHSTIYMESKAKNGQPAVFQTSFSYQSSAQHFNQEAIKPIPYDKTTEIYKKYTSEQLPQICFSPHIKRLADSIAGEGDNPLTVVKKIYYWFKENIPWTGALEYSIIPDIPEYVYMNRRGDCGMQTFLFISMLRYKGIPVRWQSGWMVPPGSENLHDWCEVYFEGTGWVPVDVSYDLQKSKNMAIMEFYLSGIDSYRLVLNNGVAGPLHPLKLFMRSEPYDFQRGEVEWKGGNLYFDKWDYDMKIEYMK